MSLRQVGWITAHGALHTSGVHERKRHDRWDDPCSPVYVIDATADTPAASAPDAGHIGRSDGAAS